MFFFTFQVGDPNTKSKVAMEDSLMANGVDQRANESMVQINASLRQKLDEEHANYKRKLQAYQDGQQRQAQLIQKLQSKVSKLYILHFYYTLLG